MTPVLTDTQPRRLELMRWYQQMQVEPSENELLAAGQQVAKWDEESYPSTFNLQLGLSLS